MTGHDDIRELLASVALGAASPDEDSLVTAHLAGCAECRAELDGLRGAVAGLAVGVPQLDPPPAMKTSIMDIVEREARIPASAPPRPGLRARLVALLPARAGMWPALAAGFAAVAVGLAIWGGAFGGDGQAVRTIPAIPTTAQVSGGAEIRDTQAILRLSGLPDVPPGKAYEVWIIRDGRDPVSAGFMAPAAGGGLVGVIDDVAGAQALAVTPESLSNTAAPTSNPIVTVPLGGA